MGYFRNFLPVVVGASIVASTPQSGEAAGFDPRGNCFDVLVTASDADKELIAAWHSGYVSAAQLDPQPVDSNNSGNVLRDIAAICANDTTLSVIDIVRGVPAPDAAPDPAPEPAVDNSGSEEDARELLMQFFAPDADLVALTSSLKPSEQDVRAVYGDPLAGKMIAGYNNLFKSGTKFGPKADHDALVIVYATTGRFTAGDSVIDAFPGGYKDITGYITGDVPIVRFKFVKSGESLGLAFDGLVYVNDHWVLMPKPWRYLD